MNDHDKSKEQLIEELQRLRAKVEKRAESDRRENEARLVSGYLEDLPAVVWTTDTDMRFTSSFGGGLKALGLKTGQVVGMTVPAFMGTDDPENHSIAAHRKALEGKEVHYDSYHADRCYDMRLRPLHGEDNRIVGCIGVAFDITEHRLAQRLLHESEARLRLITDSLPVCIARLDRNLVYTFNNLNYERWFNKPISFFTGKHIWQVLAKEAYEKVKPYCQRALAGETVEYRNLIDYEIGPQRYTQAMFVPDRDDRGEVTGFFVVVMDITEIHEAAVTLRRSKEELERSVVERTRELDASRRELQVIVDGTEAVIYIKDCQGYYLLINRRFEELFNIKQGEARGKRDHELFDQSVADVFRANDLKVLHTGGPLRCEEKAPHPDGLHTYISLKFPLFDEHHQPYAVCGVSTDITDRMRMEEQLRLVRTAIDQVNDSVVITEPDIDLPGPRILYVNPAFERTTGYSAAEVIGKTPRILQGPRTSRKVLDRLRDDLSHGRGFRGETVNYRKDKTPYNVEWQIAPVRNPEGVLTHWVSIQRDVTIERKAQEESRLHQAELAHIGRLSTMGEMASGLAHEINQPLAAISNYAQGSLNRLGQGKTDLKLIHQAIESILAQAQRADGIIKRMRSFVRKPEPHATAVDINTLIQEVVGLCEFEVHRSSTRLEYDLPAGLPGAFCDVIQIEQVILNLVRNAIDAMMQCPAVERVLTLGASMTDTGQIAITVADRGPGASQHTLDHLFDPFFTTKSDGMGMGLTISQSIVESHRGKLTISPRTGGGLIATVTLPTTTERQAPPT
ncbi:MAG: PAS domain-containing protein [Phycisphaera sp.]|nr:PAS domain-containing protein [Phycisphaera sp.]